MAEESVGGHGRHEVPERGVEPIARLDAQRICLERLRLPFGVDLRALVRVAREDVGV